MRFAPILPAALMILTASVACLLLTTAASAAPWGVTYAIRIGGGSGGVGAEGFDVSFCTGFLENMTRYDEPFQTWDVTNTFERHVVSSLQGGVGMGTINVKASGILDSPLTGGTGAAIQLAACEGGGRPQWNDTMTANVAGTYRFTIELTSEVSGNPVKPGGTAGGGVADFSGVTLSLNGSGGPGTLELSDTVGDGNTSRLTQTLTADVNMGAGQTLDLIGSMTVSLQANADENLTTWSIDAGATGNFYIDPVTEGASYTMASGVSYLTPEPTPVPSMSKAFILALFATMLGLGAFTVRRLRNA